MAAPAVLDPKKYTVSLAGFLISGYAPGTVIEVARDEDDWLDEAGADGEVAVMSNADERGTVTLTLMQSSASNDILSGLAAVNKGGTIAGLSVGKGSLQVKDQSPTGRMICSSETAWVMKPADVTLGNEIQTRVWKIRCAKLNMFVGGNT
jgi:hypothetical protein